MRVHLLGIPHTVTSEYYTACAFTQKVYKGGMMFFKNLGYDVIHYGHEDSTILCTEHVTVTTNADLEKSYGSSDWQKEGFAYSHNDHANKTFCKNAIDELRSRLRKNDILLCYWGRGHKSIADAVSDMDIFVVEPGIGYPYTFAPYRVFESYAIMHFMYGEADVWHDIYAKDMAKNLNKKLSSPHIPRNRTNPTWLNDTVIPNCFDPEDFDFKNHKEDYYFFIGRIKPYKGLEMAMRVADKMGKKLLVAGQGDFKKSMGWEPYDCIELIGHVNVSQRKDLMANAKIGFTPTWYPEPFCGTHIEFGFSGTPVLTTDWGVFSETVKHGITGYRCRSFEQFLWAAKNIDNIDPQDCRDNAINNFSVDRVSLMYHDYFENIIRDRNYSKKHPFWYTNDNREDLDWLVKDYPIEKTISKIDKIQDKSKNNNSELSINNLEYFERKPHILKLPIVKFDSYPRDSKKLAISIPLFKSKKDSPDGSNDLSVERFKDIHCKGAIWTALSLLNNSDLGDNNIPLYFHIEDSVWDLAMPVFEDFNVPKDWCRKINTNFEHFDDYNPWRSNFGKKYLGLLDNEIDCETMMFWDSDAFLLSEGDPLSFYNILTSPVFKNHVGVTDYEFMNMSYKTWVGVCCDATSINRDIMKNTPHNKVEIMAFAKSGLSISKDDNKDNFNGSNSLRVHTKSYVVTIPKNHGIVKFLISNMPTCYTDSALLSMWFYNNGPILKISDILNLPVYDQEKEFLRASNFNCIAHLRTDNDNPSNTRIDEYYDKFLSYLTINI